MKFLTRTYGGSEYQQTADYAFLEIDEELARKLLFYQSLARQAKASSDDFIDLRFWGHCNWLADDRALFTFWEEPPEAAPDLYDFMHEVLDDFDKGWEEAVSCGELFELPDDFEVPDYFCMSTEVAMLVVDLEQIYFTAYPRHQDFKQESVPIPFKTIEIAAGFRAREVA